MKQVLAKDFVFVPEFEHPVTFRSGTKSFFQILFVNNKVVRVLFSPRSCTGDPWLPSESPIKLCTSHDELHKIVDIRTMSLHIHVDYAEGLTLTWIEAMSSQIFAQDLKNRAYIFDEFNAGVFHYMQRASSEVYCGLGERTGNLNLHGRRFRLEGFDSMGYDAERTDPLYKHCPFYVTLSKESGIAYGLFYNNMSRTVLDLGAEIDAVGHTHDDLIAWFIYSLCCKFVRPAATFVWLAHSLFFSFCLAQLWGSYRYYHAECGPMDYYLFFGPSVQTVLDGFASRLGHPRSLPPRFSLGYLASSMGYAEADNAQERIEAFPDLCRLHDIPCDGLHLSSGYTVNKQGERCVFTWNTSRFPDAKRLVAKLKAAGIHVIANIKPWLLESHSQYEAMRASKAFVWDAQNDEPARVMQWSAGAATCAYGSYIDFTSAAGYTFWKQSVKDSLLAYGISGCWNDNNEFTMADDTNTFAMEIPVDLNPERSCSPPAAASASASKQPVGRVGAPIQTLLMAQCTYQAMKEWSPKLRPFVITRSATPWCHQFAAQTWSGDNRTEWSTLKFNIPMGLSAGLSAFPAGYGHDVGGFSGPKPSQELLQRWVQAGVLNPRFCIHSWNSDNSVTEPWMYESALGSIRRSMHFRMRLLPYLYALFLQFQRTAWPIMRPLFWHFQHDYRTFEQGFEYMLGSSMLVAPVWQEGARSRTVYLPMQLKLPTVKSNGPSGPSGGSVSNGIQSNPALYNRPGWFDYHTGEYFQGGREVTVEALIDAAIPPVFIPEGGMLPLGRFMHFVGEVPDNERIILLFPSPLDAKHGNKTETVLIDDDGVSTSHMERQEYFEAKVWMETSCQSRDMKIGIDIVHAGYRPEYTLVWVVVATDEWKQRTIVVPGEERPQGRIDEKGRPMVGISLNPLLDRFARNKLMTKAV